jgi:hypothetical protein
MTAVTNRLLGYCSAMAASIAPYVSASPRPLRRLLRYVESANAATPAAASPCPIASNTARWSVSALSA